MTPAHDVARRFVACLRAEIDPADFAEMRRRNATAAYADIGACASHDYCDANVVMDGALCAVLGIDADAEDRDYRAHADLIAAAWRLARPMLRED